MFAAKHEKEASDKSVRSSDGVLRVLYTTMAARVAQVPGAAVAVSEGVLGLVVKWLGQRGCRCTGTQAAQARQRRSRERSSREHLSFARTATAV